MEIKTPDQFWALADNWYQRTIKLNNIWQSKDESDERRTKAFYLWTIMSKRMDVIHQKSRDIISRRAIKKFEKGGI